MANFQPRRIIGNWSQGYALDLHTVSSVFLGHDQYGHAHYDNTYSEVGQLLFRLKYRSNQSGVEELAEAVERFMKEWNPGADIIVPVPPSNRRAVQPVFVLAEAISKRLDVHFVSPAPVPPGNAGLQPGSRSHARAWRSQGKRWRTGSGCVKQTSRSPH